jgi:O-antigen ligase
MNSPRFVVDRAQWSPAARLVQGVALAVLMVQFSGADRYLWTISKGLQYSFDAIAALCIWLGIALYGKRLPSIGLTFAYVAFVALFFAWGITISVDSGAVLRRALPVIALNALTLGVLAVTIVDRERLSRFALAVQFIAIFNAAIAIYEFSHPDLEVQLALVLNPITSAYNPLRPSGLWAEPNQGGVAFMYAAMLTPWIRGRFRNLWITLGLSASIIGVFLSSSRSGEYPLVIWLIFAFFTAIARHPFIRFRSGLIVAAAGALVLIAWRVAVSLFEEPSSTFAYALARFLDVSQQLRAPNDPSRLDALAIWWPRLLDNPIVGAGAFTFHGLGGADEGAHNIYLAIWGEGGIVMLIAYIGILIVTLLRLRGQRITSRDRRWATALWLAFVVEGFSSHNVLENLQSIIVFGLLMAASGVLVSDPPAASATTPRARNGTKAEVELSNSLTLRTEAASGGNATRPPR